MSTLSSATASGRDQVPSNDAHLKGKMCVFIVMWKDGTPFDATSVLEEDILEICVTLGHTPPFGCALVFGHRVSSSVLHHRRDATGIMQCLKGNGIMR